MAKRDEVETLMADLVADYRDASEPTAGQLARGAATLEALGMGGGAGVTAAASQTTSVLGIAVAGVVTVAAVAAVLWLGRTDDDAPPSPDDAGPESVATVVPEAAAETEVKAQPTPPEPEPEPEVDAIDEPHGEPGPEPALPAAPSSVPGSKPAKPKAEARRPPVVAEERPQVASPASDDLAAEVALLGEADQALRKNLAADAERALAAYDARFGTTAVMRGDYRALAVLAGCVSGRDNALEEAQAHLQAHPKGVFNARIRSACH